MEQIEIMPKTKGSGPEGTAEILSVTKPILAMAALNPLWRGITGAVATAASIPEESEAGIFKQLGKANKIALVENGTAVFPDTFKNFEFPTNSFAGYLAKGGNVKDIAQQIPFPNVSALGAVDERDVLNAFNRVRSIPIEGATDVEMKNIPKIKDTTNAFYESRNSKDTGNVVIRDSRPVYTKASSIPHEYTHGLDVQDPLLERIMANNKIDYNDNLSESRAFIAGSRANMDRSLTDPTSPDFFHPMLSYGGGEVSKQPAINYVNNMKLSYKAVGKPFDKESTDKYLKLMDKEVEKVKQRIEVDAEYRKKLTQATITTPYGTSNWVHSGRQRKLLEEQQKAFTKDRDLEGMDVNNRTAHESVRYNLNSLEERRKAN